MATQSSQLPTPQPSIERVSMRVIRSLAATLAKQYRPEKILLFGSYAYGRPAAFSDIDLLVVMDTPHGEIETAREMLKSLPPQPFSIDLLVRSSEQIEKRIALGDWFLREITTQGLVLYERDNQGMGR